MIIYLVVFLLFSMLFLGISRILFIGVVSIKLYTIPEIRGFFIPSVRRGFKFSSFISGTKPIIPRINSTNIIMT